MDSSMVIEGLLHSGHLLPVHDQQFVCELAMRKDAGQVTSLTQDQLDKLKQLHRQCRECQLPASDNGAGRHERLHG